MNKNKDSFRKRDSLSPNLSNTFGVSRMRLVVDLDKRIRILGNEIDIARE